ncbi:23S rRNA (uracil(1939)-C(5))-methyltransferase RlmD [Aliicoccus persicus]|uniref:23S rRNA m(5)U-1939 methyltransferase n=1 Tax=Aliicoccus persicus TaxID=930138 RepID=A0A662Z4K8_9STAP|nr:23S rRNA (uracil(1939)-C(5))-methyltransferase RlmD [Aliicoccus persicus]SEW12203.1 23S rRNA m(5)U-1939 methyltransferase [Aliicoccus persicus]
MPRKEFPTEELTVTINRLNNKYQGEVIHRHEDLEVGQQRRVKLTIPNTLPGDVVKVSVPNARGRRRAFARYDEIIESSKDRIEPACIHFEYCGGCSVQHLSYENQLAHKFEEVKTHLSNNGFDPSVVKPVIGMSEPFHYRNKMEFTFGKDGTLGMHEQGNFRKVVDISDCLIASNDTMVIRNVVSKWQHTHDLSGYDKMAHEGLLRHLMIRHSQVTGEYMVAIFATESPEQYTEIINELLLELINLDIDIESILWMKNEDVADRAQSEETTVLHGRDYIHDEIYGYRYRLWYDTFFQPNPAQASHMIEIALELSEVNEDMRVMDLFCGVGTFSLPFAERAKALAGVEIVESSIESAKRNAEDNGIDNTYFLTSDARKGMDYVKEEWGMPDLLLLDPPRSGAGGKVMRRIGRIGTEKIVYVSCNPETFAEDIVWLKDFGYELKTVQPVDQFPHTPHVELVSLLEKVAD